MDFSVDPVLPLEQEEFVADRPHLLLSYPLREVVLSLRRDVQKVEQSDELARHLVVQFSDPLNYTGNFTLLTTDLQIDGGYVSRCQIPNRYPSLLLRFKNPPNIKDRVPCTSNLQTTVMTIILILRYFR